MHPNPFPGAEWAGIYVDTSTMNPNSFTSALHGDGCPIVPKTVVLTDWCCEICSKWRHDRDICVHSWRNGVYQVNVKYCRDNADCFKGALDREDKNKNSGNGFASYVSN